MPARPAPALHSSCNLARGPPRFRSKQSFPVGRKERKFHMKNKKRGASLFLSTRGFCLLWCLEVAGGAAASPPIPHPARPNPRAVWGPLRPGRPTRAGALRAAAVELQFDISRPARARPGPSTCQDVLLPPRLRPAGRMCACVRV